MKLLLQRVQNASVSVENNCVGSIGYGLLIFLGVGKDDTKEIAEKMFEKMQKLRIFSDKDGKTNLSIRDIDGEMLMISQFTLYADCRKGNRPSFTNAGAGDKAKELYEYFITLAKKQFPPEKIAQGIFGEHMEISLLNDGPFTILLDSEEILKK